MDKSEQINELAAALAKAQADIKGAMRDSVNPFHKSKYADLESVWVACREPLTKNGLSIVQMPHSISDEQGRYHLYVRTVLMHTSGQYIADSCEVPTVKADPQGMGSAITYLRRYAIAAFASVCPTDDDAEAAHGRKDDKPLPDVNPNPALTIGHYSRSILDVVPNINATSPAQAALAPKFDPKKRINEYLDNLAVLHEHDIKAMRKIAKQYIRDNFPGIDLDAIDEDKLQEVLKALSKCFTDEPKGN